VYSAASVDGRVAVSRDQLLLFGDERWDAITSSTDWDTYSHLRALHQPQATLEGSGSFVPDGATPDPLPPFEGDAGPLYQDFLPEHVVNREGHRGWFTTVDGRGRVRWVYKEYPDPAYQGWHLLVLVGRHTPPAYLAYLQREGIPYLVAGSGPVDLGAALAKMKEKLGVERLLSTAGGRLNGALLRAGLVDEVNVEFLPGIIGGFETPALFDSPALQSGEMPARLSLVSAQTQADGRVWLRYAVAKD
jgi:hypothetical protein